MSFQLPYPELIFETTRSRGAGGQHVNRTESAVILKWHVQSSAYISDEVKHKILTRLKNHITVEGFLMIRSEEQRSQQQNKETCIEKFLSLVKRALVEQKKRVKTKPTRSSQRKRVETKRNRSKIKQGRAKVRSDI